MNQTAFNPAITIETPFPVADLPSLFHWMKRVWPSVADDTVPQDLDEWMGVQLSRDVDTYGLLRHGDIGGYFEAVRLEVHSGFGAEIERIAYCQTIFKKEMWGLRNTRPAVNLALAKLFEDRDIAFFPVFKHNRPLKEVFHAVGASRVGFVPPRRQNGHPVETEMYALTREEWKKENADFLEAVAQAVTIGIEIVGAGV